MNLVHYQPWNLFADTLLRNSAPSDRYWVPAVDIKETDDRFELLLDLPGIDPQQITVTAEKNLLTVSGERVVEDQQDDGSLKTVERLRGKFVRRFTLPDSADTDAISAQGAHGVLTITVPKREAVQPRRISVAA